MILKSDSKKLIDQFLSTFGALTLSAWLAFFIYALVASLWLHGNPRKDFRWVLFIVTFFIASRAFLETSRADVVRRVAQCLSVLGALIGAFSLFQFFHDGMNYGKVTATFRQHNSVGMYLSLCLPLSVSLIYTEEKKEMLLWSLLALLSFGGLVVSYSRGAWMGLLAGFFMVYLVAQVRGRRNTDLILFSLAVITCCFLARHYLRHDLSGRNLYWRAGIQIVHAHPFVGLGPGNYPSHIQSYLNAKETQVYLDDLLYNRGVYFWIHLHNLYLQILVEHGFLGASLFFLALAGVVQKAFGKFHSWQTQACRVSIIGFLVHNLVDITAVNSFDLLFAVLIALANSDAAGS
jgi:O-antigen ligase